MTQIIFDEFSNRPSLNGDDIHCGDVLYILTENGYERTSVEYSVNKVWYFTKFPTLNVVGTVAKWRNE